MESGAAGKMSTAQNIKRLGHMAVALLYALMAAAMPVHAAPSLNGLERKIAYANATYVRDHPNDWGAKAEAVVAARLMTTQRAWQHFRDLRCHTLAKVRNADQGQVCVISQSRLRLAELADQPDAQLEAAMVKLHVICQDGSALDQSFCYADHASKRDARITAFIAGYRRAHGERAGDALAAVHQQWKVYAKGACFRDDYDDAPMHPSSQRAAEERCLLLMSVADLSFIDGRS